VRIQEPEEWHPSPGRTANLRFPEETRSFFPASTLGDGQRLSLSGFVKLRGIHRRSLDGSWMLGSSQRLSVSGILLCPCGQRLSLDGLRIRGSTQRLSVDMSPRFRGTQRLSLTTAAGRFWTLEEP